MTRFLWLLSVISVECRGSTLKYMKFIIFRIFHFTVQLQPNQSRNEMTTQTTNHLIGLAVKLFV